MMAEPSKRSPEDLIRLEDIKDRVIACLLMVAGLLSGLADETEECPAKDMAATLTLSRAYVLEAVHLLERLPSTG
jgi:hypothetical protein